MGVGGGGVLDLLVSYFHSDVLESIADFFVVSCLVLSSFQILVALYFFGGQCCSCLRLLRRWGCE